MGFFIFFSLVIQAALEKRKLTDLFKSTKSMMIACFNHSLSVLCILLNNVLIKKILHKDQIDVHVEKPA